MEVTSEGVKGQREEMGGSAGDFLLELRLIFLNIHLFTLREREHISRGEADKKTACQAGSVPLLWEQSPRCGLNSPTGRS